jgi:hypothetical protein
MANPNTPSLKPSIRPLLSARRPELARHKRIVLDGRGCNVRERVKDGRFGGDGISWFRW